MILENPNPQWDPVDDRELWKQFLTSRTGKRLLEKLVDGYPTLLGKGDTNEILIRNGELRGFQRCLTLLLAAAEPEQDLNDVAKQASTQSYPDLADDKAWQDGQTLNPQT